MNQAEQKKAARDFARRWRVTEDSGLLRTRSQFGDFVRSVPFKYLRDMLILLFEVLPAAECDYIIGNPPFVSQDEKSESQKADMELVWGAANDGYLDYVTAWYKKAADYYGDKEDGAFAFVSTNSICQGQPVTSLFKPLLEAGWRIAYAWPSFTWKSEARDRANVHVVVVGMDKRSATARLCTEDAVRKVGNINPYLAAAPTFFIDKAQEPLCKSLKPAVYGSKPADGGFLQIKTEEEYERGMADAIASKYIRRCLGAKELINGMSRWCLWLGLCVLRPPR